MDREFGQHFLINEEVLNKEIKLAELSPKDKVIEIGTGKGILTRKILEKTPNLLSFEIDPLLRTNLEKEFGKNFVFGNAIKHSWKGYNKIVSNIPYNLSEQVLLKSIKEDIQELTLIVGENFKEILLKKETSIGIISNLFFDIKPELLVEKKSFFPKPRVNSWLIKLIRKKNLSKEEKILQEFFFSNGKIKNAIIHSFIKKDFTKNQSRSILEKMNINKEILEKTTKSINGKLIELVEKELKSLKSN